MDDKENSSEENRFFRDAERYFGMNPFHNPFWVFDDGKHDDYDWVSRAWSRHINKNLHYNVPAYIFNPPPVPPEDSALVEGFFDAVQDGTVPVDHRSVTDRILEVGDDAARRGAFDEPLPRELDYLYQKWYPIWVR